MIDNTASQILELLPVLLVTVVIGALPVILLDYIKRRKSQREIELREHIGLNAQRQYYEELLYNLQKRMSENEKRWTEINHLIVSGQKGINLNWNERNFVLDIPFFKGIGITEDDVAIEKTSIFVLTPFLSKEEKTYQTVQQECSNIGLICRRGDEEYRENDLLSHIVKGILKSRAVIVNINGRNPNVFYELGICHAIGKPVIIITSLNNEDDIPFDVKGKNIVFYRDLEELKLKLRSELLKLFIE